MLTETDIQWTDRTWNPVRGCVKVSPGCKHCYAETFAERFRGVKGHPYEQGFDLRLVPEKLEEPLRLKKPSRIFVNSMSDLYQDGVPDYFIANVWTVMEQAQRHTFQILTKRPERMRRLVTKHREWFGRSLDGSREQNLAEYDRRFAHVWLGCSVENQDAADERIPHLLRTPATVRFVSYEPALGPVDLTRVGDYNAIVGFDYNDIGDIRDAGDLSKNNHPPALDWVIVGGESGPGARPCDVAWIRNTVRECRDARIACFVKQLGAHPFAIEGSSASLAWSPNGRDGVGFMDDQGDIHLHHRKGGDPSEWPADIRVRELP